MMATPEEMQAIEKLKKSFGFTKKDLIEWLQHGNYGGPFSFPSDINMVDPTLTVSGMDNCVTVGQAIAPLSKGLIKHMEWE